jgi:hypothetical protein
MPQKVMTPQEKAKFDASLHNAATETTDTMGRILMNAILNRATTHGTLKEENVLELPITVNVRLLPSAKGFKGSDTMDCVQVCFSILGHHVVCVERCTSTVLI